MRYFISLLGLAVVVGVGYFAVAQYTDVAHGQIGLPAVESADTVSADGAQVLALLGRLKKINLDGKIFDNTNFQTLQDWSVDIAPQTVSRPNPFLQAYGTVRAASSSTKVPLPKAKR